MNEPMITGLDPQQGPESGGDYVNIFGTGFTPDSKVTFGGVPAFHTTYFSSTHLQAQPKGHSPGIVEVVVETAAGSSTTAGLANDYTYAKAPVIFALTPDMCLLESSVWVTITGTGFDGVQEVWFVDPGQYARQSPQWNQVSSTEVLALTPDVDMAGVYEVEVFTVPGGPSVSSGDAANFLFMDPKLLPTLPTFEPIPFP